jgi:Flp pilus assembly protein TadG
MRLRVWRAVRDEAGQTLAFVIVALPAIVALVVLVADTGGWFQSARRSQSVVDGAALAAAQDLPYTDAATRAAASQAAVDAANQNGLSIETPTFPSPSTVHIQAQHDVAGLLGPIAGTLNLRVSASANATAQVPARLNAVAPIALECGSLECSPGPWASNPWDDAPSSHPFTYDPARPGVSTDPLTRAFAPIRMSGVSQLSDFQKYVACNAQTPGDTSSCNQNQVSAPGRYRRLILTGDDVSAAMSAAAAGSAEHLFAIFDSYSAGRYHVIGWAAGTFSNVTEDPVTKRVSMQVIFSRILRTDGSFVDPSGPGADHDFGVRAVALSG